MQLWAPVLERVSFGRKIIIVLHKVGKIIYMRLDPFSMAYTPWVCDCQILFFPIASPIISWIIFMTKKVMMRQISLESQTDEGILQLTTYVRNSPELRQGALITLSDHKEPDRVWTIVGVSSQLIDKNDIKHDFHNNI